MFDLRRHVAVVTGGNGGIGLAMAKGLAGAGASIAVWGRDARKSAAAVAESEALGEAASAFPCSVDDEAQVRAFVSNALVHSGFKPVQYASSSEVERALSDTIPQLIVLDLSLGDSDAVEVLRILDGIRYQGDVLLISGHDELTLSCPFSFL